MIFQQDNATPHTARITRQFLANNNINVMQWPAVSPVVSPIEHTRDELARRVHNHLVQPENLQKLEAALLREWDNIPMETVSNLIHSMRRRCVATLTANGGHTRY